MTSHTLEEMRGWDEGPIADAARRIASWTDKQPERTNVYKIAKLELAKATLAALAQLAAAPEGETPTRYETFKGGYDNGFEDAMAATAADIDEFRDHQQAGRAWLAFKDVRLPPLPISTPTPPDALAMDICPACDGSGAGVADTICGLCDGAGGVKRNTVRALTSGQDALAMALEGKMEAPELFEIARPYFHYAKRGTPDGYDFERSETGQQLMRATIKVASALRSTSAPPDALAMALAMREDAARVVQLQGLGSLGNDIASAIRSLQPRSGEENISRTATKPEGQAND